MITIDKEYRLYKINSEKSLNNYNTYKSINCGKEDNLISRIATLKCSMSGFQQQKNYEACKETKCMVHAQKEKQSVETVPENT